MNCPTMPAKTPSGSQNGTSMNQKNAAWKKAERRREQHLGHDVAAGLLDRDRPDRDEHVLVALGQPGADRLAQPRAVGREVVGEHEDGQRVEDEGQHGAEDAEDAAAVLAGELPDLVGSQLEGTLDLGDVDRGVERAVDPVEGRGDGSWAAAAPSWESCETKTWPKSSARATVTSSIATIVSPVARPRRMPRRDSHSTAGSMAIESSQASSSRSRNDERGREGPHRDPQARRSRRAP